MQDKFKVDSHKLHYHPDRVFQWKYGDRFKVFPLYIEVSPVGHCNHRCTFCAVDYIGYKMRKLDFEALSASLETMGERGVKSIMYAGEGEPMLHPHIVDIVKKTKECGIDVSFTTNATAMTPRFIVEALRDVTWIKVSINGGDAKTYASIHQTKEEHWDMVWGNIKNAVDYRKAYRLNTTIGVQCLLLPDNAQTLPSLACKCREVGVDYLVIKPYSHHLKSLTTQYKDISYEDYYDKVISSLSMFKSSNFEIITRRRAMESWDSSNRGYDKCLSTPYFWAYIMATGDVYGCSAYLEDKKFCYGNIHQATFDQVWLSEKRKESMRYVANELCIDECRKNCRMNEINKYLWELEHPGEHKNFI